MTSRDELLELAKWLEDYGNELYSDDWYKKKAAAIRGLLEQKPVAWQHYEDRSLRYTQPEGFVARYYSPLYSEPVAAPAQALDLAAFKAEAMRLADAFYYADDENDRITKRAALAAQLDKLG